MVFEMTEVGSAVSGGGSGSSVDYGDNFDYKVAVTLPQVSDPDKFDINLEIFTLEVDDGKTILCLIIMLLICVSFFIIEISMHFSA